MKKTRLLWGAGLRVVQSYSHHLCPQVAPRPGMWSASPGHLLSEIIVPWLGLRQRAAVAPAWFARSPAQASLDPNGPASGIRLRPEPPPHLALRRRALVLRGVLDEQCEEAADQDGDATAAVADQGTGGEDVPLVTRNPETRRFFGSNISELSSEVALSIGIRHRKSTQSLPHRQRSCGLHLP